MLSLAILQPRIHRAHVVNYQSVHRKDIVMPRALRTPPHQVVNALPFLFVRSNLVGVLTSFSNLLELLKLVLNGTNAHQLVILSLLLLV